MEVAMKCNQVWLSLRPHAPLFLFAFATALAVHTAHGKELSESKDDLEVAHAEPAPPGVLDDSYRYHRLGELPGKTPHPTIAPTGGWYGYGFPVQSHRWGWFGAEHYYPRVVWHRGYYGDRYRWCYRRGY
jgi:hypothetical protein